MIRLYNPENAKKLYTEICGNASNIANDLRLSANDIIKIQPENITLSIPVAEKDIFLDKGLKKWIDIANNLSFKCPICMAHASETCDV